VEGDREQALEALPPYASSKVEKDAKLRVGAIKHIDPPAALHDIEQVRLVTGSRNVNRV
jgi:hypothetical protein